MADNFRFDLVGIGLERALDIAFSCVASGATHWGVQPERPAAKGVRCPTCFHAESYNDPGGRARLVLFRTDPTSTSFPEFHAFPAPLGPSQVLPLVQAWLDIAAYGAEPDHDGDNSKGVRVYNESWGHVANCHEAFAAIEPAWLVYGK